MTTTAEDLQAVTDALITRLMAQVQQVADLDRPVALVPESLAGPAFGALGYAGLCAQPSPRPWGRCGHVRRTITGIGEVAEVCLLPAGGTWVDDGPHPAGYDDLFVPHVHGWDLDRARELAPYFLDAQVNPDARIDRRLAHRLTGHDPLLDALDEALAADLDPLETW